MSKTKTEQKVKGPDKTELSIFEYYKHRDSMLLLSPRARAECTSWGMFSLFFYGMHGKQPNEAEWKEKVLQVVTEFYEKNPQWTKPSIIILRDLLGFTSGMMFDSSVLRMLEIVESTERWDMRTKPTQYDYKIEQEQQAESKLAEDEIDVTKVF